MTYVVNASKFVKLDDNEKRLLVSSTKFIPVNDKFIEYFGNREKLVLIFGSYGNGKSKFVAQDLIEKCRNDEYFKCFYGRKVYDEVRKSIYDDLCTEIEERGLEGEFTYSRRDNSTMIITHINGNKFIPYGASDSRNLKSIKDPSHIVCEEFDQFTQKDFGFLFSRLRTQKAETQFIAMFNTEPLIESHWIRKTFFSDEFTHELKPLKIFGTYKDNYFIVQNEYMQRLQLIANGRVHVMEAIANGAFGVSFNENPFFYSYVQEKHYTENNYIFNKDYFLDISFDFNISPCTALIGQHNRHLNTYSIFDLILTDSNTIAGQSPLKALCFEIKRKYIDTGLTLPYRIRVTGDASGKNGSADKEINSTFYHTIKEVLKVPQQNIIVRKKNVQHITSSEICNNALFIMPYPFLMINNVPELRDDIQHAYFDKNTTLDEAKKKHGLHIVDAYRYLIDFWFACQSGVYYKKVDEVIRRLNNIKNNLT